MVGLGGLRRRPPLFARTDPTSPPSSMREGVHQPKHLDSCLQVIRPSWEYGTCPGPQCIRGTKGSGRARLRVGRLESGWALSATSAVAKRNALFPKLMASSKANFALTQTARLPILNQRAVSLDRGKRRLVGVTSPSGQADKESILVLIWRVVIRVHIHRGTNKQESISDS